MANNRREGSLVLLTAHGAGLFLMTQKWVELAGSAPERAATFGVAAGLFAIGAAFSYVALRNSGEAGHTFVFRIGELVSLLILGLLISLVMFAGLNETVPGRFRNPPEAPVDSVVETPRGVITAPS